MTRDMELIRKILLEMEKMNKTELLNWDRKIKGYDQQTIFFHIKLLSEEGFIKAFISEIHEQILRADPNEITWKGYDFIDMVKNDTAWNKIKKTIGEVAGTSISLFFQCMLDYGKAELMKYLSGGV